jgi:hypothetical protein
MLKKPPPHVAGSYAYDSVFAGVVCRGSAEQLNSDRAFFQGVQILAQRPLHNILQELRASAAALERLTFNNLFQVCPQGDPILLRPDDFGYFPKP